ncbi:MAG: hypothetical protein KY462_06640 [Actinobacteria bacterium]|nr:hypothetical protein [Actinomycetota bacterium]
MTLAGGQTTRQPDPRPRRAGQGIAIGTGTDAAIESSDLTLMCDALDGVVTAIDLSRQPHDPPEPFVGAGYNTTAIPLAAVGCSTDHRRRRHGVLFRQRRRHQLAPAAPLGPARHVTG